MNEKVLSKHNRQDIRAIVVSGEASPSANAEMCDIALQVVGTNEVRLMTDIEGSEVVARGAAVLAQLIQ